MGEQTRGLYDKINVLQSENESLRQQLREAEKKLALAIRPYEFEQLQAENLSLQHQLEEALRFKHSTSSELGRQVVRLEFSLERLREAVLEHRRAVKEIKNLNVDFGADHLKRVDEKLWAALAELEKGET